MIDPAVLQSVLDDGCARWSVPSAQVGLLRGDKRLVVCAGLVDPATGADEVSPSTAFHAGSLAKSLAALVVIDAAHRGELDLDVPTEAQAVGLWPETPRVLLSHTSGRPNVLPEVDEGVDEFVARAGAMPLVHRPGRFSYCNAGWVVVDALLRRRCGGTFEELASDRILRGVATFGMPDGGAAGHSVDHDGHVTPVPTRMADSASAAGARWWATADELLDYAALHLRPRAVAPHLDADAVRSLQERHAHVPGPTMADGWGLGWALWDRRPDGSGYRAFGGSGYTGGHRAYLRCLPEQDAALVVLAGAAGPILSPPGGSALFDDLLPRLLEIIGAPPPAARPSDDGSDAVTPGTYGPVTVEALPAGGLRLHAGAFGEPAPLDYVAAGNAFVVSGEPPGTMPIAVDDDLLYVGPFGLPRTT